MNESTDTLPEGGADLSIDEAAKAYAATLAREPDEGQPDTDETSEAETDDELQATDEDAGEDADGETDDAGQADEEDPDAEPETEGGRFVAHDGRVRLPDGSVSTVAEIIQGNLRDRDYRQKTMEAAEVRKAAESQSLAIKERETQLTERLDYAEKLIQSIVGQEPDPALLSTDPMAYMSQKANWEAWQKHIAFISQERQTAAEKAKSEAATQAQDKARAEWDALLGVMPQLKDEKRLDSFASDLKKFGATYKLTPQEIGSVPLDHRFAVILNDAIQWKKLQASKAAVHKKVEGRPPVTKGGKRLNPGERRERAANDSLSRLQQSGRLDDAVAAYLATKS